MWTRKQINSLISNFETAERNLGFFLEESLEVALYVDPRLQEKDKLDLSVTEFEVGEDGVLTLTITEWTAPGEWKYEVKFPVKYLNCSLNKIDKLLKKG